MKMRLLLLVVVAVLHSSHLWYIECFSVSRTWNHRRHGSIPRRWHYVTTSSSDTTSAVLVEDDSTAARRPLHQNWWPVSTLSALQKNRPNALEVLGKNLVAFYSDNNNKDTPWTVLDDRCSHRFAPLSEGRIEVHGNQTCLQCAYHGWEFDSSGTCTRVPQDEHRVDKARPVQAYPTRNAAGLLWVWTDPHTVDLAKSIPLPINVLLELFVEHYGENACFMRDLPYGMEILGENLIDLSHLPYAHHSIGPLKREMGKDLPTKMLSKADRTKYAQWELDYEKDRNIVLPTFQAEIMEAATYDPVLMSFAARVKDPEETKDWKTTIAFFSPNHVRYRRTRGPGDTVHVELFMCPRSESRSRVFLFNAFETVLETPMTPKRTLSKRLLVAVLAKLFDPRRVQGHMTGHSIFDGDGIFLHKQGNRMKRANLTYKDYSTPSSADVMLNAYRRYLDSVAAMTREAGLASVADAVVGTGMYGNDYPRSEMLDRYNTHTASCPVCLTALKKARSRKSLLQVLQTALTGAAGASTGSLLASFWLAPSLGLVPGFLRRLSTLTGVAWLVAALVGKMVKVTDKRINSFLFEDYVHAEKS